MRYLISNAKPGTKLRRVIVDGKLLHAVGDDPVFGLRKIDEDSLKGRVKGWVVDHIPTGSRVGIYQRQRDAKMVVAQLIEKVPPEKLKHSSLPVVKSAIRRGHKLLEEWIVGIALNPSVPVKTFAEYVAAHPSTPVDGQSPPKPYFVEVKADDSGRWCGNGLTFATIPEAEAYAKDLTSRWTAVREWRVVESEVD
ncbi:MAG: hypothetical protein ACYSWU_18250 [Planctomycetota bacterium]|jgi:hypothetical protein